MPSKSKKVPADSPSPIFPLLQALDSSYPDFPSRLSAAAGLLGLSPDWQSFDPRVALNPSSTFDKNTPSNSSLLQTSTPKSSRCLQVRGHAHAEWVLRYLLENLDSKEAIGSESRLNELTWKLLNLLLYLVPLSSAAKLLKGKGICAILERTLDEILAKVRECHGQNGDQNGCQRTSSVCSSNSRDIDSDGDVVMGGDPQSSDSEDQCSSKQKRKSKSQHVRRSSQPALSVLPPPLTALRGISLFLTTLSSNFAPTAPANDNTFDSIPIQHLRSVRRCESDRASRILGRWLFLMSECAAKFSTSPWHPRLDTILPIWTERISRSDEGTGLSSELFAQECLVPVFQLLGYSATPGQSTISPSERRTLENLVMKALFLPAYRAFVSSQDTDSHLSSPEPQNSAQLREFLRPLAFHYSNPAAPFAGSPHEGGFAPRAESVVSIFRAVVAASPSGSHQQRMKTKVWLEAVFIELLNCVGITYFSLPRVPPPSATEFGLETLGGMVNVLCSAEIQINPLILTKLFIQVCGLDLPGAVSDKKASSLSSSAPRDVPWSLIAALLRYSPMIFLPQPQTASQTAPLDKYLIRSIISFLPSPNYTKPQLLNNVILPWSQAFLEARQFGQFVSLWFDSLASLPAAASTVLRDDCILHNLSHKAFAHASASPDKLITTYRDLVGKSAAAKQDGNDGGEKVRNEFDAAVTVLTCVLVGLSPRTLSASSFSLVRDLAVELASSPSFSSFFHPDTLVSISRFFGHVFRLAQGFEAGKDFVSFAGQIVNAPNFSKFLSVPRVRKLYKNGEKSLECTDEKKKKKKDKRGSSKSQTENEDGSPALGARISSSVFELNLVLARLLCKSAPCTEDVSKQVAQDVVELVDKASSGDKKSVGLLQMLTLNLFQYPDVFQLVAQSISSEASHSLMTTVISALSSASSSAQFTVPPELLHHFVRQTSFALPISIQTSLYKSVAPSSASSSSSSVFAIVEESASQLPARMIPRRFREGVINQILARIERAREETPSRLFDGEDRYFATLLGLLAAPGTTSDLFTRSESLVNVAARLDGLCAGTTTACTAADSSCGDDCDKATGAHDKTLDEPVGHMAPTLLGPWFSAIVQAVFSQLEFLNGPDRETFGSALRDQLRSRVSGPVKKFLKKAVKGSGGGGGGSKSRPVPVGSLVLCRELLVRGTGHPDRDAGAATTTSNSSSSSATAVSQCLLPAITVVQKLDESGTLLRYSNGYLLSSSSCSRGDGSPSPSRSDAKGETVAPPSGDGFAAAPAEIRDMLTSLSESRSCARARAGSIARIETRMRKDEDAGTKLALLAASLQYALNTDSDSDSGRSAFLSRADALELSVMVLKAIGSAVPTATAAAKVLGSDQEVDHLRTLFGLACSRLSVPLSGPGGGEPALRSYVGQLFRFVHAVLSHSSGWLVTQPAIDRLVGAMLRTSGPVYLASLGDRVSSTDGDGDGGAGSQAQISTAGSVFLHTCRAVRLVLLLHRSRLAGRFHLLVPVLQNLLACLFYNPLVRGVPTSSASSTPGSSSSPSLCSPCLTAEHAAALNRVLITLTSPSSSSHHHHHHQRNAHNQGHLGGAGAPVTDSQALVDTAARARKHAGRYAHHLIIQFCRSTLGYGPPFCGASTGAVSKPGTETGEGGTEGGVGGGSSVTISSSSSSLSAPSPSPSVMLFPPPVTAFPVAYQSPPAAVRAAVLPGVFAAVGLLDPAVRRAMVEEMDHQTGAVWVGLAKEWDRECGAGAGGDRYW